MNVAKPNETKQMLEKNLQFLTPWLQEAVLNIDEEEMNRRLEITYNQEGLPVCCYKKEGKQFYLNGKYPQKEAEQWYCNISKQGTGTIMLFGTDFSYPLFELFQRKQPHTLVIVFEQDIYLFKAMLSYFDLQPIFKTHKIIFLVGDNEYFANAFEQLLYSAFFIGCTYPTLIFSHSAQRNFKEEYHRIYQYVVTQLTLFIFYVGNDHQDNLIGFCNLVSNVHEIIKAPYISWLKDQYKDIPAFIIANGPSLDKNIQQLKQIQGKGLIIAVESAIIPLLKNNIKPDILAVIERTKNTYIYHFKDIHYSDDIALFSLAVVNKHVYPSFPGPKIPIFREKEVVNEWFSSLLGDGVSMDVGANVSHLATEVAAYLGANPIVYVGQDFAYGVEGVSHSTDSIYSEECGEKLEKAIQSMPTVYVEGNNGGMIPSTQLWLNFKLGLERKIATHPNNLFLNATEGGARIEGTTCDTLQHAIEQYCKKQYPQRVNELILEIEKEIHYEQRINQLEAFIERVEEYEQMLRQFVSETIIGKLECQEMLRLSMTNSDEHRDTLEKAYQNNIQTINRFMEDGIVRSFLQQAIVSNYYFINRLGDINTPEKITEMFGLQYQLYSHFNVILQSVSVHFKNAVKELKVVLSNLESNCGAGEKL